MNVLKKLFVTALLATVGATAFSQVVLPEKRNYSFDEVYDMFVPTGDNEKIYISIDGDVATGRVSFLQGKNPMTIPDEKGNLMQPDPKFKTFYCPLIYHGGEESRSFHLVCDFNFKEKKCLNEWVKLVVTFRPRRNGKIKITVHHGWFWHWWYETKPERTASYYPNLYYAQYCGFEVKNIPDKGFTIGSPGWGNGKAPVFPNKIKPEIVTDNTAPAPKYIRTPFWFEKIVTVKGDNEGKTVCMMSFYVRSDKMYKSKY